MPKIHITVSGNTTEALNIFEAIAQGYSRPIGSWYSQPNGEMLFMLDGRNSIGAAKKLLGRLITENIVAIRVESNATNGEPPAASPEPDQPIATTFVQEVTVIDPDSHLPVEVEIRKMASGMMVGLDAAFLANTDDDAHSPYDKGVKLNIPDDEPQGSNSTASNPAPPPSEYGKVTWNIEDVQTLFDVTDEEAQTFLAGISSDLQDRMTERGWEVMETLGDMQDLPRVDDDDEEDEGGEE